MSVEDWGKHLTAALSSIDGIVEVRAYDELPGQIVASPTLIWFPLSGTQSYGMGSPAVAFHRVQLSLFVSVGLLPEGVGIAVPFIGKVRNTLAGQVQLGGAVTQIIPPMGKVTSIFLRLFSLAPLTTIAFFVESVRRSLGTSILRRPER